MLVGMVLVNAAVQPACDRSEAGDVAEARKEAQQEISEARREADKKIAEARREADKQVAEARQEAREKKAEARSDVAEERRELQAAIKNARQDTKEEFMDFAKKRAQLIALREGEAKDAATRTPPADQKAFDSTAREIDDMQRSLQQHLKQLEDNKPNWPAVRGTISKELDELEARVDKLSVPKTQ